MAKYISNAYTAAEKIRVGKNKDFFINELPSKISDRFNNENILKDEAWIIKGSGNPLKKYDGNIQIFQKDWKIIFLIQFESVNMKKIYWRFSKNNNNINLEHIRDKFNKLKTIKKNTKESLEWNYFDNNLNLDTFEFNQEEFVSTIIEKFKEVRKKFQNEYSASFENINK